MPQIAGEHAAVQEQRAESMEALAGKATELASKQAQSAGRAYYDVAMLKPPVWTWEIPTYFFLGGVSAGAYLLSRAADRFGGDTARPAARTASLVALGAFAPCPALLISDLGDPRRFHYMLRVFKPKSPMNLGAWTLAAYGAFAALGALVTGRRTKKAPLPLRALTVASEAALDGAGVPAALTLAGYTGVLLSTSSTPVWARNPWIGPLFSAGAVGTGVAAVQLAMAARDRAEGEKPLHRVSALAKVVEAVSLAGYLVSAGSRAQPLTTGKQSGWLWGGGVGAGLAAAALLESMPARSRGAKRGLKIAGAVAALAGGFALRWAVTRAGIPSAANSRAAQDA